MTDKSEELGKMIVSDFKSSLKINTDDLYNNQLNLFKIKQEVSFKNFKENIKEYNNKFSQEGPKKIMEDLTNKLEEISNNNNNNQDNIEKIFIDLQIYIILSSIIPKNNSYSPVKIKEVNWEAEDFLHKNILKKEEDDNCIIS